MIKAEFYGGPMHDKTTWVSGNDLTIAYSVAPRPPGASPVFNAELEVVLYHCMVVLPDRSVYVAEDEKSLRLLEWMNRYDNDLGYFLYCEAAFLEQALKSVQLQSMLAEASRCFLDKVDAMIDQRRSRKQRAA